MKKLLKIRENNTDIRNPGLADEYIIKFLKSDPKLEQAIDAAAKAYENLKKKHPELLALPEAQLAKTLQDNILNFYQPETVSPYVPLAAKGPWIISTGGAVIYDTGGYGMLGFGHNPDWINDVLASDYVMANVMTPSFCQYRCIERLKDKIAFTHKNKNCPFQKFVFMNSGSEAGTVATRISDAKAKLLTDPEGKHAGKQIKFVALEGSFHGRTMRTARVSHSTQEKYQVLASFRNLDMLLTVLPNDIEDLKRVFKEADENNIYIEAMFIEPVMGEGNPGLAITREFYDAARKLTKEHDTFLIVDSIQAGLRTHGVLSIIDYPGFADCEAPDMETFSKALNGGQFPLSVLALKQEAADCYQIGTYGNTMTANPRALEVACIILDHLSPDIASNVSKMGNEFVEKLLKLKAELPDMITKVQGTGLLLSAELADGIDVVGYTGVEMFMRLHGINVIHGGVNSLRFTPHLRINSDEIDLMIDITKQALLDAKKS